MQRSLFFAAVLTVLCGYSSRIVQGALITRSLSNTTLNAKNSGEFALDVDLDGIVDFNFQALFTDDPAILLGFAQTKFPFGSQNGVVISALSNDGFPSASLLVTGNVVGANSLFSGPIDTGNLFSSDPFIGATGNFGGNRGSLGFRFESGGSIKYGFADISVNNISSLSPFDITLNSVSFESVGGQAAIVAVPEPTSAILVGIALLISVRKFWHRKPKILPSKHALKRVFFC